jgi:hypothetical protein
VFGSAVLADGDNLAAVSVYEPESVHGRTSQLSLVPPGRCSGHWSVRVGRKRFVTSTVSGPATRPTRP